MNIRAIPKWENASGTRAGVGARALMTRRQLVRRAAGATVVGALGTGWWNPAMALSSGSSAPIPIPGGTPALGGGFHVFGPTPDGSLDPIDAEPSTITDFNGFVGLAYLNVPV